MSRPRSGRIARALALIASACAALVCHPAPGGAQQAAAVTKALTQGPALPSGAKVAVPSFWNAQRRIERPDAAKLPVTLRFATADDYPPFNFLNADGALAGFNVDLARALCAELDVTCTIQAAPFATLVDELEQGRFDAAIAGISPSPVSRARLDFSERYLGTPARFVGRAGAVPEQATPEQVASRKVAVVARTAHEAYLRTFFPEAGIRTYSDLKGALDALKKGEVDLVFADGITLALWLNGTDSVGCCVFAGGPFTESRFFGDGFAIAVKAGNATVRGALDYALQRVWEKGIYTDLYLRWFPISFY